MPAAEVSRRPPEATLTLSDEDILCFTFSTFWASCVKRMPDSSSFPCSMSIRWFSSVRRVSELARVAGVEGALLAVRDRREPVARDTVAHEIIFGRARALLAEGQVVLDRAALVAVSLDHDAARVLLEVFTVSLEGGLGVLPEGVIVE